MNFEQKNIKRLVVFVVICATFYSYAVEKTIFTFLGSPGAGKGTLSAQCASQLGFKILSTGNLCRQEIASGSQMGKMIREYTMTTGLVPDEVIAQMVEVWLEKQVDNKTIILDGYPRTQKQAKMLSSLLKNKFPEYRFRVVFLYVPDKEEIIQRLSNRLVCKNKKCQSVYNATMFKDTDKHVCKNCGSELIRREDDAPEVVQIRLDGFAENNNEIISFYNSIGVVVELINASNVLPQQLFSYFKNLLS